MKIIIINFINKQGFEIIKQPFRGNKYPNLSKEKNEYYCETPVGKFHLPLEFEKDAVASELVRGNIFEPEIIEIAKRYIKPQSSVIDIGANFGQMSLAFSKLAVGGKVYSFEAQNFVFNFLQKNMESNNCSNVKLYERAVYNNNGETLYFPQPDLSNGAPYSGNSLTGNMSEGIPVQTITIDSLNIKEHISFMKIDIEGADIFALQGAKETIMKNRMPIIFEYTQHMQNEFGSTFGDYVSFVNNLDYKFEEIISKINYLILPK